MPTLLCKESCVVKAIKLVNKTRTKKIREDFRKYSFTSNFFYTVLATVFFCFSNIFIQFPIRKYKSK